jgi:hypothetical protein
MVIREAGNITPIKNMPNRTISKFKVNVFDSKYQVDRLDDMSHIDLHPNKLS